MFKNITKKILATIMGLGLLASGLAPMTVLAKNNDNNHGHIISAEAHLRNDLRKLDKENNENDDRDVSIMGSLGANVQAASNVFHQAMQQAIHNYQNTKAAAKAKLRAALNASQSMADRIAAWKTYLSDLLAAFQQYAAAREAALAQFISALVNPSANRAPVANAQSVTVQENRSVNITLTGSDPEASPLTYFVLTGTSHGTLSGTVPNLIYMPSLNFTGTDSFTFKVNDGSLDSPVATVTVNVTP